MQVYQFTEQPYYPAWNDHSGSLRVNDVEVPMSELYDADTIRIGDAQLRFNRAGFDRAVPSTGEDHP